jgi:predicted deacetylase
VSQDKPVLGSDSTSIRVIIRVVVSPEQDQAIELALQACDERDPFLIIVAPVFPQFRRIREDTRFADIRRRLRLPE